MPRARCKTHGCPCLPTQDGLCGYHSVKAEWGEKWARLTHPNHPEVKNKPSK